MPDMTQTENVKAKGTVRVLKLRRETLRELDARELKQVQGGKRAGNPRPTKWCDSYTHCTNTCG